MPQPSSHVVSPAGIRLAAALLGPFLTEKAQAEVEHRWGTPVEDLFNEAVTLARTEAGTQAFRVALAVWTRHHDIPQEAAARLGDLLASLPQDTSRAQHLLNTWAAENTDGMIGTFPCTVDASTRAVLASAIAINDSWTTRGEETYLRFQGNHHKGFVAPAPEHDVVSTPDGNAVCVTRSLSTGLLAQFALSTTGADHAADLLEGHRLTGDVFTRHPTVDDPFITTTAAYSPTTAVSVVIPEFTLTSRWNLRQQAAEWGLAAAFEPGAVPGLGDLEIAEAAQEAFIEVSRLGVRAAAVTAMAFRAASAMFPRFEQREVVFGEPFAYQILIPSYPAPLFTGTYAG